MYPAAFARFYLSPFALLRRLLFTPCLPFSPWTSPSSIAGPFITLAIFALEFVHLMTIPFIFLLLDAAVYRL